MITKKFKVVIARVLIVAAFTYSVPEYIYSQQLEYLAVHGRASMAAFRQHSTHGQKFDPEYLYEPM